MRIYVVELQGQGGLVHYSYHMCRALQREGADVTLVTATNYELDELPHDFKVVKALRMWSKHDAIKSGTLRIVRRGVRGVRYVIQWAKLVSYLRRERPDVVLFGEIRFPFEQYFLLWLKQCGLVIADVVHDVERFDTTRSSSVLRKSSRDQRAFSEIYGLFDKLFVHNRSNRELFLKLYGNVSPSRVCEIPHGVNEVILEMQRGMTCDALRERLGLGPHQKVILFFGTVAKYKGVTDLISAMKIVRQDASARLVIAGFPTNDTNVEELRAQAMAEGVADRIIWWLDYVPNDLVASLMDISDVVALPYRAITQSGILHIAYACGKPVLATRVGGLPDVVEDGRSGRLVQPEQPNEMGAALASMLSDPERLREMGQYARMLADTRYSWERVARLVLCGLRSSAQAPRGEMVEKWALAPFDNRGDDNGISLLIGDEKARVKERRHV